MFSASKTAAPVSGAYQISNSVRLRSAASAYFSRTPSVAGNQKTWTWSGWVKRGAISGEVNRGIFGGGEALISFYDYAAYGSQIVANLRSSATNYFINFSNVFRDPSAWYHFVFVLDTTQATASNRFKFYVNGVQVTSSAGSAGINYPPQNWTTGINAGNTAQSIGAASDGSVVFDGYLADINFIDGQALTPSSFGQINPTTGVWQPIKYAGTYGTNGFHLAFNNGTSTTTLGYDSSGNGNNWTPNNISLTAGSTYDWMLDSPTPFAGTSYGVGNYAVLNPLANSSTLVDANLRTNGGDKWSISTIGMTSGKWYCEVTVIAVGAESSVGISSQPYSGSSPVVGGTATSWGYYSNNGNKFNNTSGPGGAYGSSYTTSDVIGIALDADAGTLTFYKNNVSQGTAFTGLTSGPYYFAIEGRTSTSANNCAANFGQRPFAYTPPTGYKTLCTQNLPVATIYNGANFMAATTYTGTGATQTLSNAVNGVSFQPDMVWVKCRSVANNHVLYDSVRGAGSGKALSSSLTAQEGLGTTDADSKYGYVSTLDNSGFSVAGGSLGQQYVNTSGATYVGWQWKAGGTAVTNTAGSITSQVSANTTAGFSVVTYTGNGNLSATVGHGLGVAPAMVINKGRSDGFYLWRVYHQSITSGNMLLLNSTLGAIAINSDGGISSVGSSTFGFSGGTPAVNATGSTYVAYCFAAIAGYSAFGSYTGNGSADGPFVWCGFRPRFVLIKCSSTTGYWYIFDSARNTYNVLGEQLYPNLSNAGSTVTTLDILSNGFKMRISTDPNASATYIYAAFASSPFNSSLAF